jgi:HK97 family phage major capsid protein
MILKDLQDRRNKLITDAQALLHQETVTAEHRSQFDTMMADVVAIEADIDRVEKLAKLEAETRSTQRPPRPNPGTNPTEVEQRDKAAAKAFENYIRYGKDGLDAEERTLLRERRDLTTANAGYLVPQLFNPSLIDARKLYGNLVNEVGKKVTNNNGAPIKVSLSNDTGNTLTTLTAEATVVAEQDPTYSGFVMNTDTVATLVKVSTQELEDSYFDLASWLKMKFGMRYYNGLEYLLVNGNGSNVQAIPAGATLGATTASNVGPTYTDFAKVYGALEPAYLPNAKWGMSTITRAYIMGLEDNYGRPLFIPSPNSGALDKILGLDIVLSQPLPSATTPGATGILLGDFEQGYLLRTDGDISIRRLDERFADSLETGFLAYARVGGKSTDAGTHPILTLATHA